MSTCKNDHYSLPRLNPKLKPEGKQGGGREEGEKGKKGAGSFEKNECGKMSISGPAFPHDAGKECNEGGKKKKGYEGEKGGAAWRPPLSAASSLFFQGAWKKGGKKRKGYWKGEKKRWGYGQKSERFPSVGTRKQITRKEGHKGGKRGEGEYSLRQNVFLSAQSNH